MRLTCAPHPGLFNYRGSQVAMNSPSCDEQAQTEDKQSSNFFGFLHLEVFLNRRLVPWSRNPLPHTQ